MFFLCLLKQRLASQIHGKKSQVVFLINNYDQVRFSNLFMKCSKWSALLFSYHMCLWTSL
jgi:hypothetical protein